MPGSWWSEAVVYNGHQVCTDFGRGVRVQTEINSITDGTFGLTFDDGAYFVIASVTELCPRYQPLLDAYSGH